MTPDFVVQEPSGYKFFRTQDEAVSFAQEHGLSAYRMDYQLVMDEHLPYEQQVRTLLWEPEYVGSSGQPPASVLEQTELDEAA